MFRHFVNGEKSFRECLISDQRKKRNPTNTSNQVLLFLIGELKNKSENRALINKNVTSRPAGHSMLWIFLSYHQWNMTMTAIQT